MKGDGRSSTVAILRGLASTARRVSVPSAIYPLEYILEEPRATAQRGSLAPTWALNDAAQELARKCSIHFIPLRQFQTNKAWVKVRTIPEHLNLDFHRHLLEAGNGCATIHAVAHLHPRQ
jgi:hypothetical protein